MIVKTKRMIAVIAPEESTTTGVIVVGLTTLGVLLAVGVIDEVAEIEGLAPIESVAVGEFVCVAVAVGVGVGEGPAAMQAFVPEESVPQRGVERLI
jgi:hypothetical protein